MSTDPRTSLAAAEQASPIPLSHADELSLAERMIAFDTSAEEGIRACAGYLSGWLEAREIDFRSYDLGGLPVLSAKVGDGPVTVVLHTHIDVVPGSEGQFIPYTDGEYLWGRGAYDMKGATAAMFAVMADLAALPEPLPIKVRLLAVPDEEWDDEKELYGTELLIKEGHVGDFVVCGEPTDFHVGIQAKGVLGVRIDVDGKGAHGATPWLGVNAIVRAMDVWDTMHTLPFATESSSFFDRPSINLGRIVGGGRLNQVPEQCSMEVDIRYLPEQPLDRLRDELHSLPGCRVHELLWRPPAHVSQDNEFLKLLRGAADTNVEHDVELVGRDGTNDGVHFLKRGIPSVEFGPVGAGHHGPQERVSIRSLRQYRLALLDFLDRVAHDRERLTGITIPSRSPDPGDEPRSII